MSWINIEHNVTILCIVLRKDWFVFKNCLSLFGTTFSKKSLCPENISFISHIMIMVISLNQHGIGSYLMQCRLNSRIYLKALPSELRSLLMFLLLPAPIAKFLSEVLWWTQGKHAHKQTNLVGKVKIFL